MDIDIRLRIGSFAGRFVAAAFVCAAVTLQGCGSAFPPAPPRATSFPSQNVPPSVIAIPISVRVRNVQQALNRAGSSNLLDSGWRAVSAASNDGFADVRTIVARSLNAQVAGAGWVPTQFRLTARRDPVRSGAGPGGTLRVAFNDRYLLELRSPAGGYVCAPRTQAAVVTAANVAATVRPGGAVHANVSEVAGRFTAFCSAAGSLLRDRDIDLTPALRGRYTRALYRVADILTNVLQRTVQVAVRVKFATLATTLAQPIEISANSWLTPNLQNASVRRLSLAASGNDLLANFDLALAARPQLLLGTQPTASPAWPPRFSDLEQPDGFALPIDVRVPFDLIAQHARAQLKGTELPVKVIGTVRVDDVDVYATDAGTPDAPHPQLVVQVDFSGGASGKLYLWGTPTIDPATRVISMPDLTYTTDTRRLLVRFLAPLLTSNFVVSRVRNAAVFDASKLIDEQTAPFMKPFDHSIQLPDGTTAAVHAVPAPVGLNGIGLEADAMLVRVAVNGSVNVDVDTSVDALSPAAAGR